MNTEIDTPLELSDEEKEAALLEKQKQQRKVPPLALTSFLFSLMPILWSGMCCCSILPSIAISCSLISSALSTVAIVLAVFSKKKNQRFHPFAKTGMTLGIIVLVISILSSIFLFIYEVLLGGYLGILNFVSDSLVAGLKTFLF